MVLQLLAIGDDGQEEVKIQKRLHRTPICSKYRNRAVPLLDLITYEPEQMVFGAFPLLFPGFDGPKHQSPAAALWTFYQWFEVSHKRRNLAARYIPVAFSSRDVLLTNEVCLP